MHWIFIAILSHLFWALTNIIDKYFIGNRVKNPYVYMIWLLLLGILSIFLIPFVDFVIPSVLILLIILITTGAGFFGFVFYIQALQQEEVTRVNILWNLIPVFSFFIAWFFLGEKLSDGQILALVILVIGAIIGSFHWQKNRFEFSRAFWLMILSTLLFSVYAVMVRYVSQILNPYSIFIWISLLFTPYVLLFFLNKNFRKSFIKESRGFGIFSIGIIASAFMVDNIGNFLNIKALSSGPVALVFAMEGWQVFFVFVITIIISLFSPKLLQEKLDKTNIILKIVAMILMIIGVVMVYLI